MANPKLGDGADIHTLLVTDTGWEDTERSITVSRPLTGPEYQQLLNWVCSEKPTHDISMTHPGNHPCAYTFRAWCELKEHYDYR